MFFLIVKYFIVDETLSRPDDSQTESQDTKIEIKKTGSLWYRIIKLGKQEWRLYILAFFMLFVAALGKKLL